MEPIFVSAIPPEHAPVMGARSSRWPAVEKSHLAEQPGCQVCGVRTDVNVHHIRPFHVHPELELDPSNLITLCRVHHLWWGHLGCWSSWNERVVNDAAEWRRKIASRPST